MGGPRQENSFEIYLFKLNDSHLAAAGRNAAASYFNGNNGNYNVAY